MRRAVIEGTATFTQSLYRQRYLHDEVSLAQRLEGMRSVIGAAPGACAVERADDLRLHDGPLQVRNLYRRTDSWQLVNRALRDSPRRSTQILHPRTWPVSVGAPPVRLGIGPSAEGPTGGGWVEGPRTRSGRS